MGLFGWVRVKGTCSLRPKQWLVLGDRDGGSGPGSMKCRMELSVNICLVSFRRKNGGGMIDILYVK